MNSLSSEINEMELQNIRHLVLGYDMEADKYNCYAQGINSCLVRYEEFITQTENQQLRQTLQQIRNECETSQYELYTLAKSKSYYQPAGKATKESIQNVKSMARNTGVS